MNIKDYKISVLGGGSWATAIIKMLCENTDNIVWYMRSGYVKEFIEQNNHNPNYLSSIELHNEHFNITNNIDKAVENADIIIVAIPSAYLADEFKKLSVDISDKIVFTAIKGIIPESGLVASDHIKKYFDIPSKNVGVVSGPCHAEEVALERLSYLTVASENKSYGSTMAELISSDFISVKLSRDVKGIEYATTLKNIFSIASGICHGLGYGDNFQSVLMSNAIRETKRFLKHIGKDSSRNINHSVYLGDLLVTCYSVFSRNRMFGNMVGKGYTVKSAIMEMTMVTEGYYACKSAYELCKNNIDKFPIIHRMYEILYKNSPPKQTIKKLANKIN